MLEEEIRQIQERLRKISFYDLGVSSVIPDGIYGSTTKESVMSFQRNNNLYETGEVDNDTWDKINEEYRRTIRENEENLGMQIINEAELPIKIGDAATSLFVLQAMMYALAVELDNLDYTEITGVYDAKTQNAAEKIMILSGLEPKAELDREFINTLGELYMTYVTRNHVKNSSEI